VISYKWRYSAAAAAAAASEHSVELK
jgi:hypothetical protein